MRNLFILFLAAIGIGLMFGCGGDDGGGGTGPTPVPDPRLVVEVHQDPGLASVDHAVWDSIDAVTVALGTDNDYNAGVSTIENLNTNLQALRTASYLYIKAEWNDNSKNTRFNEFKSYYRNNINQWEVVDTTLYSNEDRFYFLFDNGGTNGANCAALCHTTANGSGRKFYGAAGDNADVWHWKAARTGLAGFAEDMLLTTTTIAADPQDASNDSLYFRNWNFMGYPQFMHPDTLDYTGDALLEGTYITFDNTLPWVQGLPNDSISLYVPGYYLNQLSGADGSRWDINVVQEHDGANWTVVFRRALNTGDGDDINLTSVDSISISIAVGNNSGVKHWGAEPFYMVFE
ncbi:MAG: ethylbenzene dehydrogenase-related protein [Candidatus Zixiibacteriota bacterium]